MDELETKQANDMLQKKYDALNGNVTNQQTGIIKPLQKLTYPEIDWKTLAHERAQLIEQFRDEMHAWNAAYTDEKARADRLEKRLFALLDSAISEPKNDVPEEQSITIKTQDPINKRIRANWPTIKSKLEKKFSRNEYQEEKTDAIL